MPTLIPITSTLLLGHCWVCGQREGLNEHHLVPQSCGGTHGPTVTMCAAHHTVIHTEAYHPEHKRRFEGTLLQRTKLAYLAEVIYRSYAAVQGEQKPVQKTFVFSVRHQQMWNAFRATRPTIRSDQEAMEAALELLYQHTRPLNRS